jgi:hypothetical protein
MSLRPLLATILALLVTPTLAAEAHVHGRANLAVAIDGATLTLMLESPTDSLVGFEHAPRDARQRATVAKMKQDLEKPADLFKPTPAAGCKPTGVKLESALFEVGHDHQGHTDLDGEFIFQCAQPERLRDLEVRLFDRFPNLHRLHVEIAGPNGQKAMQLDAGRNRVSW